MQVLTVDEFKAKFSEVLKRVVLGEEIGISYGKKREIVARLIPKTPKRAKRKIGILEGKANACFNQDFNMLEKEFLGL